MGDIAAKAGISKGAVYLCVESKAALFDLALRHADNPESFEPPPVLPVPTPAEGATRRYVSERLTTQPDLLELISALANKRVTNAREELEEVIRRLYRLLNGNRWAIKSPVFSFHKFPDVNKTLGPQMKSTGEAIFFIDSLRDPLFRKLYSERNYYLSK